MSSSLLSLTWDNKSSTKTTKKNASVQPSKEKKDASVQHQQGRELILKFYRDLFGDTESSNSSILQDKAFTSDDYYPKFTGDELQLGKVLGKGGFGTVYEIKAFHVVPKSSLSQANQSNKKSANKQYDNVYDEEERLELEYDHSTSQFQENHDTLLFQSAARQFLAQHCLRQSASNSNNNTNNGNSSKRGSFFSKSATNGKSKHHCRYAMKQLSPEIDVQKDAQRYWQGLLDLAIETRFLCALNHPNLIKLRGLAKTNPLVGGDSYYFIILDRLYQTLEQRMDANWKPQHARWSSSVAQLTMATTAKEKFLSLWEDRLVYLYDVASALQYMHSNCIIYRDLKPENCAFDVRNDIKLFDFGLCRELQAKDCVSTKNDKNCLYRLTAATGSPRYMAPEVALGQPYNESCDVYSFCILLWQVLALQTPFEVYTMTKMKERVWAPPPTDNGKPVEPKRPQLPETWSTRIKLLLKRGWSPRIAERFTMQQVEDILFQEIVDLREGNESGLEHERRRSSFVLEHHNHNHTRRKGSYSQRRDSEKSPGKENLHGTATAAHKLVQEWYEEEDLTNFDNVNNDGPRDFSALDQSRNDNIHDRDLDGSIHKPIPIPANPVETMHASVSSTRRLSVSSHHHDGEMEKTFKEEEVAKLGAEDLDCNICGDHPTCDHYFM